MIYDYILIGGGIVGISTAWQLQRRFPRKRILLLEKEKVFSAHQTGHNSGVVHAGVYYAPGSLKAQFCKAGARATIDFCRKHDIACERCGKLLVATDADEAERMQALYERCLQNKIEVELLDEARLSELEPNIVGHGAILVKDTAIVDYRQVSAAMLVQFEDDGGRVRLEHTVTGLDEDRDSVRVEVDNRGEKKILTTRFIISCSGLMADRVAEMIGIPIAFKIIPYRGEYYQLAPRYNDLINHLIYPIPDPGLPFLGVHLTRMIDGTVTVGPNAVQGWKREGYGRINISLRDTWEMLRFPGFWRATLSNFGTGAREMKNSLWKPGYLQEVRKYCPRLRLSDLKPYPAGIRAQAVLEDGSLVHDFLFAESPRSLHVCNAPSPAATSAIPIGGYICDKIEERRNSLNTPAT